MTDSTETDSKYSSRPEWEEISLDGAVWVATEYRDGRYRMFRPAWEDDAGAYLPGEKGLCSYCLEDNPDAGGDSGQLVCDACGETETIVCADRESVGDVKQWATNRNNDT